MLQVSIEYQVEQREVSRLFLTANFEAYLAFSAFRFSPPMIQPGTIHVNG